MHQLPCSSKIDTKKTPDSIESPYLCAIGRFLLSGLLLPGYFILYIYFELSLYTRGTLALSMHGSS